MALTKSELDSVEFRANEINNEAAALRSSMDGYVSSHGQSAVVGAEVMRVSGRVNVLLQVVRDLLGLLGDAGILGALEAIETSAETLINEVGTLEDQASSGVGGDTQK